MKPMIETMKTRASHISIRTLALVLCFVMLIGAIGTGTVLTAIAKEFEPSGESVLAAAALSGADVTIPEDEEAETDKAADSSDDAAEAEDNDTAGKNLVDDLIARLRAGKEDLAGSGAEADLAATGTDYYLWYDKDDNITDTTYSSQAVSVSGTVYTSSFTWSSTGVNIYFTITDSSDKANAYNNSIFTNATSYSHSGNLSTSGRQERSGKYSIYTSLSRTNQTVYVSYDSSTNAVTLSTSAGGGGGGETPTEEPTEAPTVAPTEPEEAGTSSDLVTIAGVNNLIQVYYDFSAINTGDVYMYTTDALCKDDLGHSGIRLGFLPNSGITTSTVIAKTGTGSLAEIEYTDRSSNNKFNIGEDGATSTGWSSYTDFYSAPTSVLNGTKVMFYIETYPDSYNVSVEGKLLALTNNSTSSYKTARRLSKGIGYLIIPKNDLSSYKYITNKAGEWAGESNSGIENAAGGEVFVKSGANNLPATTATTTAPARIAYGTTTLNISTQASNVHSAIGSNLSSQYYIKVGDTWHKVGTTYTTSTTDKSISLDISTLDLAAGTTYALKTVLTDGGVYYVADSDNIAVEKMYDVTISAGEGGSVEPSGTQSVGITTGTTVTATPSTGYSFSSWTKTKVTTANDNASTTVTADDEEGTHSLAAVFTKNSYTVSYTAATSAVDHGTFTVTQTTGGDAVATGASLPYDTGITVTCTPDAGYEVDYVKVNDSTSGVSGSGNTRTFSIPAADAAITVAFKLSDLSISKSTSPAGKGTVVVSKSDGGVNTTTYQVGDTLYLSVTSPDAAYTVSSYTVTYGDGTKATISGATGDTGEIDATHFGETGAISIVANLTKKPTYKITVKTNNIARGTASANITEAYEGQTVTLTAVENTGTFNEWTVESGTVSGVNNDTNKTKSFTMGSTALTIKANFDEYTGTSDWYYNGYTTTGMHFDSYAKPMTEAKIDGKLYSYYHVDSRSGNNQLFTVSYKSPAFVYGAYDYIYFHGYTDTNDVDWAKEHDIYCWFQSSDGVDIQGYECMESNVGYDGSYKMWRKHVPYGAKYVYFKDNNKGATSKRVDLSGVHDQSYMYFYISGNENGYDVGWTTMDGFTNPVPTGFHEYFQTSSNSVYVDTASHSFGDYNVTISGSHKIANPSNAPTGASDSYYVMVLYPGNTYTVNGDTVTVASGSTPKIVYTDSLPQPVVVDDTPTVDIYAKNGSLRDSTFNRFTNLADTDFVDYFEYTEMLDSGAYTYTSIADYNASDLHEDIVVSNNVSGYNSTYAKMTNVPIGAKIKLKTTLSTSASATGSFNSKAFSATHYLKAYSFNGATYELHEPNSTGVYEEIWTVRDVNTKKTVSGDTTELTKDGRSIEVTPIYYMQDNSNCKTFYIDGYDGEVQGKWGNMLSVYPYYEGKSNSANAFGGYPGQPMLFWGGKYQMEIPLTDDGTSTGATVKGLTLHNGFWDLLHRSLDNVCDKHSQTYDYDDFYKLYKEKNPDTIIFDFKYRTTKDNFGDGYQYTNYNVADTTASAATYAGSGYNGVELITDYFGRQVDVFGTLISDANKSDYDTSKTQDKELLIVSTGYKDTYVGEYATLWAVYAPQSSIPSGSGDTAGKFIGYISSSMLYLSNLNRRSQYTDGSNTAAGKMSWSQNIDTYTHLKTYYTGVPALISYEEEIYNDSKDKANRSDGKWYYSNKNDQISANILVQYCDTDYYVVPKPDKALNDDVWTTDTLSVAGLGGELNVGETTGCSAYFTNTSPYLKGKTASGKQFADSTKKFTFEAVPSGQYLFVNWVRYSNGKYYEVSEKEVAESPMSSNDTYIARFVKTTSSTLKISHVVEANSTYTGTGTPNVTVTVTNGDTQVFTETSDDGTPIDISRYMNTKYGTYKIDISLSTTPDEDSTLHDITNGSGIAKYNPGTLSSNAATVTQFTVFDALEGDNAVSTLRYVSHLTTNTYTYNYKIRYTYTSRFWGEQYYDVEGTLVSNNAEQMMNITGKKGSAQLKEGFIENMTPFEKNFRQIIEWNYTYEDVVDENDSSILAYAMTNTASASSTPGTYNINVTVDSANVVNDKVTADILLPYKHDTIEEDYAAKTVVAHHSENDDSTIYDEYIFDEAQEAVTVEAQAYKLFTTNGSVPESGDDHKPSEIAHLVEAAPYVWKNPAKRYVPGEVTRYFTGTYFTINNVNYYYGTVPAEDTTGVQVLDNATFTNTWHEKTYKMSVIDETGTLYSFQENGANGQYTRHTWENKADSFYMYDTSGNLTGTKVYFTRWDIYSSYDGSYVASSYNRRFNYSGYENYRVKAVYESDALNPAAEADVHNVPTITYLGDTRNQWTAGGNSGLEPASYNAANGGDKLLHDFAISFDYYEEEIREIPDSSVDGGRDIKIGMLIEKLGALDSTGDDMILDPEYYADKYKGTYNPGAIEDYFEGNITAAQLKTALGASAIVNSKIGANVNGWGNLFTDDTGNIGNGNTGMRPIDNMNRLQWYYTFTNTKTDGEIGSTNNANFVYRASAYIIDDGVATASSTPVYFTLYDSASR